MLNEAIDEVPYIADPVEVGKGGFATVYRATDLQAGRPVAVKLLSLRSDDATLKYFDRERESLARLSTHPNVVTLHRTGVTTGGVPYLVMEFASGGSLSDRLKAEGPFRWDDAVRWVLPICGAVEHAHDQGIRHRDIKPQNILISDHGAPLLSDFGIAGLSAGTETITRKAKLSLSYASPDQIDGRELDDSTDIYSLGATLYTLIAGAPAFADTSGTGFLNTAKRILEERPPDLDDSVPADIRNAIAAAMAKNPAYRPTIDEFRRALDREITLDAPPPGDELPDITREIPGAGGALGAAILASAVADDVPTLPGLDGGVESADQGRIAAAVPAGRVRALSLVAIVSLLVAGLVTVAWAGRGGDTVADGDEPTIDADLTLTPTGSIVRQPAGPEAESSAEDGEAREGEETDGDVLRSEASTSTSSTTSASVTTQTAVAPTTVPDRDDDGALDVDDNCPDAANPDQRNSDGDALGDACDPDDDDDGVPDDSDNCRLEANGDQADVDGDDLGDACDDFPDRDDDGIIDTDDPCVELPGDNDSDGDGTPDKCDDSPRGMVVVSASAKIDRVTILNEAYSSGEADMFGDLTVAGEKFRLPEISDMRDIRPGNWLSDRVEVEPGVPLVRIRIWIRDEDDCFLCKDGLVDVTPETGSNALHLVIDTATGTIDLASESWNRIETIGILTGPADGDLSGTISQQGEDDDVHLASIDVSLTLVREPAP